MTTSSEQNMTPEQHAMPKHVQREAYKRIPMTCDTVRGILDEAQTTLMNDLDIDPADVATVDAAMSHAFQRIRDEVTQTFRTEQMKLLNHVP